MRPSLRLWPLLLVLGACEGGFLGGDDTADTADTGSDTADTGTDTSDTGSDTSDTSDTSGGDTATTCAATVTTTSPADDEMNVAVNKVITARFSHPVGEGDWSLSVDGVTGTAELGSTAQVATFVADSPLATDTTYTLHASACDDDAVAEFTTASGPLAESDLDGRTYALAYEDVTWVQPAGLGSVVNLFGEPFEYLLVNVIDVTTDTDPDTIHAAGSLGITDNEDIVQDPCTEPYDFGVQDFSGNPVFEVGPTDIALADTGTTMTDAYIKAAFVEEGEAIEDIRISGQIDVNALAGMDLCGTLAYLGVACVQCAANSASSSCLDVVLVADRAEWVEDLEFDPDLVPDTNACN